VNKSNTRGKENAIYYSFSRSNGINLRGHSMDKDTRIVAKGDILYSFCQALFFCSLNQAVSFCVNS